MKIKTNELTRPALDWAVANAEGMLKHITIDHSLTHPLIVSGVQSWGPSFIWSQGGPIIEQERITLLPCDSDWEAQSSTTPLIAVEGPTPLIAAMRCYVASKLGDEVDIPEELQ